MNPYMKFMNPCPFPYQGNQMQYQSYPHPSNESIPQQFRGYPDGYHSLYHPPWGSSGMYPSQNYGCCNHNFFPPYCPPFMPYSHHPTHCCGGYSVPPGAHPCNFLPMHPTMGPTQFEYQKDNTTHQHCFDCPSNTLKGENTLKIEDSRMDPKGDISLVPSDFTNSPYPIVLGPPDYIKDNISRKENETTCDRKDVSPNSNEKLKAFEPHPLFLNGWLPVDIDKWRLSEKVEDSGKNIHNDNEKPYLPLPFFYLPYKSDDTRMMEQKNVGQQCSQGVSPISIHVDSSKNKSNEKVVILEDPRTMEKKNEDDFPTDKKEEENEGKKVAQTTDAHVGNEAYKTSVYGKRKSSSPQRSSKFPPVCLRVDPLPKKKKGCSPEKSSTPCDEKDKACDSFTEDTKSKASPLPNGFEFSRNDMLGRDKLEEHATSVDQPQRKIKAIKVYDAESLPGEVEDLGAQRNRLSESTQRVLSEDEAAKIIQSGYRGYKERKWEPLKKLKNIKAVQEKVTELKKQIESLGCTPDNTLLEKSRTIIGETIMNLFLKLDSIQGLPPNVRQVRKSVARDLMSLQEQLDALGQRHDEKSIPSPLFVNSEEEVQTPDNVCIHCGEEKYHLGHGMGTEIEENKNHEEPPLIELSKGEENEAHKEDALINVADRYPNQLNNLLQNGIESFRNECSQDVSSNTVNLESESLFQSVDNDQVSGVDKPGKEDFEAARLIEELNCVPNMDLTEPHEQVFLESEENKYRDPEQTSISSKMTNLIEMDDINRPEHDTFDLNEASVNAKPVSPVSEDSITKQVQVSEVCEGVQAFSSTSDKNADDPVPEPVANQVHKGFIEAVQNSTEESERVKKQNESIVELRCEELERAVNEDHNAPADLAALPQEQKQTDESLEMQTSKLATEMLTHPCERTESERVITERSLIEENERLRAQLKKLIEAGQEQLSAISSLSGKLKDLERKLNRKKKVKLSRSRGGTRSPCLKMSMDDDVRFAVTN